MVRSLSVPAAVVAVCAALKSGGAGAVMTVVELGLTFVLLAWLFLIARHVAQATAGKRRLSQLGSVTRLEGHDVCVLGRGLERSAFVLGSFRPQIYVSDALVAVLDRAQLHAVLLHEEHHRRRRDPLRSVALEAWQRLFGWLPAVRWWLERRHADLEIAADDFALRHGASRAALASALLKCDAPSARPAFGADATANMRVRRLVSAPGQRREMTPGEWLAPVLLATGFAACHVLLG